MAVRSLATEAWIVTAIQHLTLDWCIHHHRSQPLDFPLMASPERSAYPAHLETRVRSAHREL